MPGIYSAHRNPHRVAIPPSPKRITITIPYCTYTEILERSIREGRSFSNLASYLLQQGISALS